MRSTLIIASLTALAAAKTNLAGCTSSATVAFGGASMIYWDPTNGEICSFLDCGGGRAPPKTTVPGCPQYSGTASYTPDYMPGWGQASQTTATSGATSSGSNSIPTMESTTGGYSQMSTSSATAGSSTTYGSETTMVTSKPVLPTISGSPVPSGGNGTTVVSHGSPTPTSSKGPLEQTNAAVPMGAKGAVVGVAAGLFGLVML